MSNLIRYIIQEDPEKQMKKKQTNRNNKMTNLLETPFAQIFGAASDMYKNYNDMKEDNVIGNDDYFHCKANYESTQRGKWGEKTAEALGDAKERIDYFKNRIIKGTSAIDAYADYEYDKYINSLGRHQAKSGLYTNAKDGCEFKRKKSTNKKILGNDKNYKNINDKLFLRMFTGFKHFLYSQSLLVEY